MADKRVTQANWDKVEKWLADEHQARKNADVRREHERKWKEVDRQIRMEPLKRLNANNQEIKGDWHNALEMGQLSTASEIIAADVKRIVFSQKRWFEPHVELNWPLDEKTGRPAIDDEKQTIADGLLRNLMCQQHKDFGFIARFMLSVKEALHHGSFAAEIRQEEQLLVREGSKIRKVAAPVWVPYSMWNTFPDPSPFVIGTNLFYSGSMILVEYLDWAKLKGYAKGEGWMQDRLKKVEKRKQNDGKDIELVKLKGDIFIERSNDEIWLPNSEAILANGKLVYYRPAPLDYPNVIYGGYERQDVRDPYYTSPIIKQSPTQKLTTISANKFLDAMALKVEPPVEYDANDPEYAAMGGPDLQPGAKTGTRSMGQGMKALDIGEPRFALDGYTLGMQQMQEGLGVSANRTGVREADRETATAANLANQGAEVRTMDFVSVLEPQALLPFLYMQHDWNRREMSEYSFYSDEMHTPDFVRAKKQDIQANAHFDVVGSRGLLGEEQRKKALNGAVAFFSGNPLFAPKLKTTEIMLDTLREAGKKNPEDWVQADDDAAIPPEVQQQMQQMGQLVQQLQAELQQAQSGERVKMLGLQLQRAKDQGELAVKMRKLDLEARVLAADTANNQANRLAEIKRERDELRLEYDRLDQEFTLATQQLAEQRASRDDQRATVQ